MVGQPSDGRLQELREALRRIDLQFPAIPTKIDVDRTGGSVMLRIHVSVPDRRTGAGITVTHSFKVPDGISCSQFLRFVEQRACGTWIHEFEEAFHLDGERIREPHPHGVGDASVYRIVTYDDDDDPVIP